MTELWDVKSQIRSLKYHAETMHDEEGDVWSHDAEACEMAIQIINALMERGIKDWQDAVECIRRRCDG